MIALAQDNEFVKSVEALFSSTGDMSHAKNFEYRKEQQQLAVEIAEALTEKRSLIAEAGTGVGKSLAYLFPAIMYAKANNKKAVISTHTINLQEQLMYKDLPIIQKLFPQTFEAVLLKGRQNYLCPNRLARALESSKELFTSPEFQELQRIYEWSQKTEEGSISEFDILPDSQVWSLVCSEPHICTARLCPPESGCFYQDMRRKVANADVIVTNHTLFFLLLSGADIEEEMASGYLFANDFAILDEAHTVEGVASRQIGVSVSQYGLRYVLSRLYNAKTGKGLLVMARNAKGTEVCLKAQDQADDFFMAVEMACGFNTEREMRVRHPDIVEDSLSRILSELWEIIQDCAADQEDEMYRSELKEMGRRVKMARDGVRMFLNQEEEDFVYWVEKTGKMGQYLTLNAAPVDISEYMRRLLFREEQTCVMTSATLSVGDSELGYFRNRIGAEEVPAVQIGSPFDYEEQMKLYLVQKMPDPRDEGYEDALIEWIKHFTKESRGRAFVLFTSYRIMHSVAERMSQFFENEGMELFLQGGGMSRHKLVEGFRNSGKGVLFGTDSFWGGVDVPGEALSNVIITRLPFAVPNHPMIQAKMEYIEQNGGNSFQDYSLPEAILKFRQGFGRLIRTRQDRGMVVVLDNRILGKSYGRAFLRALPSCPIEVIK